MKPSEKSQQISGNCTLSLPLASSPVKQKCKSSSPPRAAPGCPLDTPELSPAGWNEAQPGKQAPTSRTSYCLGCCLKRFFLACSPPFCWTGLQARVPSRKGLAPFSLNVCLVRRLLDQPLQGCRPVGVRVGGRGVLVRPVAKQILRTPRNGEVINS